MARNPLRDGWRVLLRAPESIPAEIAWRWAFGAAFWGLLILSFHQYFSRIEISPGEYALIKALEPFTWLAISVRVAQAFVAGLRDMGPILIPALGLLWLLMATIGRAVTVRALAKDSGRTNWASLFTLNAFRLLVTFAALLAYCGAAILISHIFDPREYYGLNVFLLLAVIVLLLGVWGMVNWFVSLAQIFAAQAGGGFTDSLRSAAGLYQAHAGTFFTSGIWFSIARLILLGMVTLGSLSPLGNMTMAGVRGLLTFVAIISLLYFAAADTLNMWRLGVYISLMEPEVIDAVAEPSGTPSPTLTPQLTTSEETRATERAPADPEGWNPIAEN